MARGVRRVADEQTTDTPLLSEPVFTVEQKATARANGSVIQAGRDVVTGNIFAGRFSRLRDVWLDPEPVFDEVDVDRFTGREWLIESVDNFLRSHDRGYVVVQAAAGLGKTAFAAWLARSRDWPCHFTRRRKGRAAATALRNLAAQLIARYELAEQFAPGGMLPETAGEPGWFDHVLRAAARNAGGQLVLVVDGLDEAEHVSGDLPLGLPASLPAGVFVLVTCRTGTNLPALRQPWKLLAIEAEDRRNTTDLRQFLRHAAADETLANLLERNDMTVTAFTRRLIDRCGGVWMYLRYVLDELRYGLRTLADLDQLPADLVSYYLESLTPPSDEPDWASTRLPLLATLAAAAEPLPIATLARHAGLATPGPAQALCHGQLRPFLTVSVDDGDRRYAIYHASLREFLTGSVPHNVMDGAGARAHELAQATSDAHARIADGYLNAFGGLATQLTALAAKPALATADSGYPRRHLTYHLDHAGRADDLHRLLACEQPTGEHSARNIWFEVHDRAGTLGDYLADIRRARRHAEHHTDRQLDRGRSAVSLGDEIHYAVMTAAVTTLTANVPTTLLERLVTVDLWDVDRALGHARGLHDPFTRARTLAALMPHLSDLDRTAVATEAMNAARATVSDIGRAEALRALAKHLPERQRPQVLIEALSAARSVTDEHQRVWALSRLATALPEQLVETLLPDVRTLHDGQDKTTLLTALIPRLPATFQTRALSAARAIPTGQHRVQIFSEALPRLPESRRDQIWREALTAAHSVTHPANRARAYWRLAMTPELSDARREELLEESLAAARAITGTPSRAVALARLVPDLTDARQTEVLAEAHAAARSVTDRVTRTWVMTSVATAMPEPDRDQVLAKTLTDIRTIEDEHDRARALSDLASVLPEHLLERALTIARDITAEYSRAWVLGEMAPHLPTHLVGDALAAAQTISDGRGKAQVLGELARYYPEPRRARILAEAVATARAITVSYSRAWTLTELAQQLHGPWRAQLMAESLVAAEATPRLSRPWILWRVAHHLPEAERRQAFSEASIIARELDDPDERAWALCKIAPYLPKPQRDEAVGDALTAARETSIGWHRTITLAAVSFYLPEQERNEALAEAFTVARALTKKTGPMAAAIGKTARHILRHVPDRAVTEALALFHRAEITIVDHNDTEALQAVEELTRYLTRYLPRRLLTEALTTTKHLPSEYDATSFLGDIALYLPEPHREQALTEALTPARETTAARRAILTHLRRMRGEHMNATEIAVLRRCLDTLGLDDCLSVLACAIPIVRDVGGRPALDKSLEAIRAVQRWWHSPNLQGTGQ